MSGPGEKLSRFWAQQVFIESDSRDAQDVELIGRPALGEGCYFPGGET